MKRVPSSALLVAVLATGCNFPPPPNNDIDGATDDADVDARDGGVDATDAPIDGPPPTCSGLRVAFDDGASPTNQVFIAATDGSERFPLAPSSALDYAVTGAPQGYVAFTTNRDGNLEVYRVNADGTGLINLTMNAAQDGNPRFSRGGTKIAYARSGALWVMNADGTDARAVTAGNSYTPRWSPDDTQIVFELSSGGSEINLWIVNADGSGLRQLTGDAGIENSASWSPDGTQIAFRSGNDLHIINADGTGRVNLTNDATQQYSPAWSPDGTKIAFAEDGQIKTMAPTGGTRTPISTAGTDIVGSPQWSPDGTRILWARVSQNSTMRHVVVANADGSAATAFAGPTNFANSMDWVACP